MVLIKKKKEKTPEELEKDRLDQELRKVGIEDEFQAKGFELVNFVQDHKNLVLGFIGLVIVGGLIGSGAIYYKKLANEKAGIDFSEALAKDDGKNDDAVLTAIAAVSKNHPSTSIAGLASLYAGHLQLKEGHGKEAVVSYKEFLSVANRGSELRPLALTGLAYAHLASGDKKQAMKTLEELLAGDWEIHREESLLEVAKLAQELGESTKAKEYAQKLIEKYPTSPLVSKAKDLLGLTDKVKVE